MRHFVVTKTARQGLSRRCAKLIATICLFPSWSNHAIQAAAAESETATIESHREPPSSSSYSSSSLCGVYLARSTIPGAGFGMFAGHYDYEKGDLLGDSDLVIPAHDMKWNNYYNNDFTFLWEEYTWKATNFGGMKEETDKVKNVKACSPGFGAAVNCILPLVNAADDYSARMVGMSGVDSATSPGAGGFTPYYGRRWRAKRFIPAGMELYGNYGSGYFRTRDGYNKVPLWDDYKTASRLLRTLKRIARKVVVGKGNLFAGSSTAIATDLLSILQTLSDVWEDSRAMHAIPSNADMGQIDWLLDSGGTGMQHYNSSIRSPEWLQENGRCMDNIKDGVSTIPHAGRGAFARRFIPKGGLVAPAPLIQIPNRTSFVVYEEKKERYKNNRTRIVPDIEKPVHAQLLLNYCFGHRESSVLLCPYGLLTSLINHNSFNNPNTKVVWADDAQMANPEWRQLPVKEWGSLEKAGLSFDFIAIRDIAPGEEITIDYGTEWTQAWQEHVQRYESATPRFRPKEYMSAFERNKRTDQRLPTMYEQKYTYSNLGVRLFCRREFLEWNGILGFVVGDDDDDSGENDEEEGKHFDFDDNEVFPCRIRLRKNGEKEDHDDLYVAEILKDVPPSNGGDGEMSNDVVVEAVAFGLPRAAFYFADEAYQRDHHQPWSFRHDMRIPDDIFPEAWKDTRIRQDNSDKTKAFAKNCSRSEPAIFVH